ncbi:unnamed protein product, partial [marine sediment metagenome]
QVKDSKLDKKVLYSGLCTIIDFLHKKCTVCAKINFGG